MGDVSRRGVGPQAFLLEVFAGEFFEMVKGFSAWSENHFAFRAAHFRGANAYHFRR
jgi:hypothetical protein